MTKEELVSVAERCWATWNQYPPEQRPALDAWWRILSDLDVEQVHKVIDGLAVSSNFCPRPGDLRRLTLGDDSPSPSDAWASYMAVATSISHGTQVPESHPLVGQVIRKLGAGLHTNGDRQFFVDAYAQVVAEWRQETFRP